MSSIQGKEGLAQSGAYGISKAGVIGLTKVLGKDLAGDGITVNCVTPAAAETDMAKEITPAAPRRHRRAHSDGTFCRRQRKSRPWSRFLHPTTAHFSTGAVFDVSGGRATY